MQSHLEERLLCAENLDRAGRVFGEVHEAASVRDQSRTNQLTN